MPIDRASPAEGLSGPAPAPLIRMRSFENNLRPIVSGLASTVCQNHSGEGQRFIKARDDARSRQIAGCQPNSGARCLPSRLSKYVVHVRTRSDRTSVCSISWLKTACWVNPFRNTRCCISRIGLEHSPRRGSGTPAFWHQDITRSPTSPVFRRTRRQQCQE